MKTVLKLLRKIPRFLQTISGFVTWLAEFSAAFAQAVHILESWSEKGQNAKIFSLLRVFSPKALDKIRHSRQNHACPLSAFGCRDLALRSN